MKTILDRDIADHDADVFMLLAHGWTATHTVGREFRINNAPPEDLAIIERLVQASFVIRCNDRTYVAAVYPLKINAAGFH